MHHHYISKRGLWECPLAKATRNPKTPPSVHNCDLGSGWIHVKITWAVAGVHCPDKGGSRRLPGTMTGKQNTIYR